MNPVIDRIIRDLRKAGDGREADALEWVVDLYADLNLADLIALLRAATELDSPLARVKYMDDLMQAFDDAAQILGEKPEVLAKAVRQSVQAGVQGTAEMFAASQVVTDAFRVPPTLQLKWMDFAEQRMLEFWGTETPRFRQEVQTALRLGLERGQGIDQIVKNLRERTKVSRTRAIRIARNEIGHAASFAMKESQAQAGSTHYIWRTASDDRVRDEHKARNGKVFAWDNPPAGGHPGEDYLCRCVAIAMPPTTPKL